MYLWVNIAIIISLIGGIIQNTIEGRKLIKIEKRLTDLEKMSNQ
jgi:hypothetical protein